MNKIIVFLIFILITIILVPERNRIVHNSKKTYKVVHIASYSSDFIWVKEIEKGIENAFKDNNLKIDYSAFYMDTKRKSNLKKIKLRAEKAIDFILEKDPDIIITSDENALLDVAKAMETTKYKFVSCGINGYPKDYDIDRRKIAIVLERLHYVEAIKIMQLLVPGAKKIVVLSEKSKTSDIVLQQFQDVTSHMPVEILNLYTTNSFEKWKQIIKNSPQNVDAIMFLLYFSLKDKHNRPIETNEVMQWIVKNTKKPDFSAIPAYAEEGGLITVSVNGISQGYASADIASKILKGAKPQNIKPIETKDGIIQINAQRAKQLKLRIPLVLYESSRVYW